MTETAWRGKTFPSQSTPTRLEGTGGKIMNEVLYILNFSLLGMQLLGGWK